MRGSELLVKVKRRVIGWYYVVVKVVDGRVGIWVLGGRWIFRISC